MSTRGSIAGYSSFPRLQSATFEPLDTGDGEIEVNYRSGGSFKGQVQAHKRIGRGIFTWPNGARYEGEFSNNVRMGSGLQNWPDGSKYEGQFQNDLRHGDGEHTWANKETYNGRFFQDRRHGNGTYTWPDGSTFTGTFYMDRKEGFGVFQFANGNKFEGLYREDEREGPGVMTYPEGSQDVGLWQGEKLVKICSAIKDAFSMKNHKDFDYDAEEHVKYLEMDEPTSREAFEKSLEAPHDSDYLQDNKVTEKVSDIFNIFLDPKSLAINKEAFDREFYPNVDTSKEKETKVRLWNNTPSMIAMQKHFKKHSHGMKAVSVNIDKIVAGDRSKFKKKGPLELASEELIQAATEGNVNKVEDLLTSGKVSPDVGDKNGHTPLIGASVNWHIDVINCLLNHGADVNKLSDEGCSALSAGCIFFYPIDSFKFNIAERYLKEPSDNKTKEKDEQTNKKPQQQQQQQQQQQHSSQPPKSILSKKTKIDKSDSTVQLDSVDQDKESLSKDAKNNQNLKQTPSRQQVRIEEDNVNSNDVNAKQELDVEVLKEEFDSDLSLHYYEIEVSDNLIERCATQLSMNEKVVGGRRSHNSMHLGRARHLAVIKNERERMKQTLDLLLRRGADPNASSIPMPALFFAIKAADVDMVRSLLEKQASTSIALPKEKGGLAPLHIAVAIPGEEGVQITELLLQAGADPNVRAQPDDAFLNKSLMDEWSKDPIPPESEELLGGRVPLHIACARDDNYKNSTRVVRLLLDHKADTNLLCNGFSPLALSIASGNDMAIDELLVFGNDVSLPLTHGVGSALCAATNIEYEYRRPIAGRLHLIDKLVRAGANLLAPIPIGPKRLVGTVVDYAYYVFNQEIHTRVLEFMALMKMNKEKQDTYIAKTPYHALTHAERETFINRRRLLEHIGDILRTKAVDREKRRLEDEQREGGARSVSPSSGFVYIGAGAPLPPDARRPKFLRNQGGGDGGPSVKFEGPGGQGAQQNWLQDGDDQSSKEAKIPSWVYLQMIPPEKVAVRKPLFKYCYQCGRSVFVRLSVCTRCKEVYYCSKACKLKAWNARHKEECIRVGGRSRSPSPNTRKQRSDSPTPATNPDKGRKTTVAELNKDKQALRIHSALISEEAYSSRPTSGHHGSGRATPSHASTRPTLSASTIRSRPNSGQVTNEVQYGTPKRSKLLILLQQHLNAAAAESTS